MYGRKIISSAQHSTSSEEMKKMFYNNNYYANILFSNFTKKVEKELDEFLKLDLFERSGGGIGVTRMIYAMKQKGILHEPLSEDIKLKKMAESAAKLAQYEESKLEQEILSKTKRSRCWGLPVAPSDKKKRNLGAAISAATVAAGEKAMEVAAEHAASFI